MKKADKADAKLVVQLVDKIKPILAHQHPRVQGAVCCELTAYWLAGHAVEGADCQALMQMHVDFVGDITNELVAEHANPASPRSSKRSKGPRRP